MHTFSFRIRLLFVYEENENLNTQQINKICAHSIRECPIHRTEDKIIKKRAQFEKRLVLAFCILYLGAERTLLLWLTSTAKVWRQCVVRCLAQSPDAASDTYENDNVLFICRAQKCIRVVLLQVPLCARPSWQRLLSLLSIIAEFLPFFLALAFVSVS